jgi:hypothetical protein
MPACQSNPPTWTFAQVRPSGLRPPGHLTMITLDAWTFRLPVDVEGTAVEQPGSSWTGWSEHASPPPPPAWVTPPATDGGAIAALTLAICSFFFLPILGAVIALTLAPRARRRIAASGGRLKGRGLVTAAKVVAWCELASVIVATTFTLLMMWAWSPPPPPRPPAVTYPCADPRFTIPCGPDGRPIIP